MFTTFYRIAAGVACVLALLSAPASANRFAEPDNATETPTFAVRFGGEYSPYPLISAFVMPGEELEIEAVPRGRVSDFLAESEEGDLTKAGPARWVWTAPTEPGLRRITISDCISGASVSIKTFVLTPYSGESELNGYAIGRYNPEPLDGDPAYELPRGLVEVTPELESTWVSPHFQLRDFLCKQESEYPKYLILKTRLLLKLELLQEEVARLEGPEARLRVMSAYRTPAYNRKIGNETDYSRHLYGDAADVFIDRDGDETMDDLNGDGQVTTDDAGALYALVDSFHDEEWYEPFVGGLGLYGPKRHRGPFIHVDTRGSHAQWGDRTGSRWIKTHAVLRQGEADGLTGTR